MLAFVRAQSPPALNSDWAISHGLTDVETHAAQGTLSPQEKAWLHTFVGDDPNLDLWSNFVRYVQDKESGHDSSILGNLKSVFSGLPQALNPFSDLYRDMGPAGTPEAQTENLHAAVNEGNWNPLGSERSGFDILAGGTKADRPEDRQMGRAVGSAFAGYFAAGALAPETSTGASAMSDLEYPAITESVFTPTQVVGGDIVGADYPAISESLITPTTAADATTSFSLADAAKAVSQGMSVVKAYNQYRAANAARNAQSMQSATPAYRPFGAAPGSGTMADYFGGFPRGATTASIGGVSILWFIGAAFLVILFFILKGK
jgi:hypothetical protein